MENKQYYKIYYYSLISKRIDPYNYFIVSVNDKSDIIKVFNKYMLEEISTVKFFLTVKLNYIPHKIPYSDLIYVSVSILSETENIKSYADNAVFIRHTIFSASNTPIFTTIDYFLPFNYYD